MIGEHGENLGVLKREEALALARPEEKLDLIEIVPTAKPPVCRLMSFDKYRYEREKAEKKERMAQKAPGLKHIQISARAASNDLKIKLRQLEEFLGAGHRVEIQLRLRGREKGNKEWARQKLEQFLAMITTNYERLSQPKLGGRGLLLQIGKK